MWQNLITIKIYFAIFFSCFFFPYDINAKNPHLFYRKKKSGKENRALFIFIYSRFYRVFLFRKLQKKSCLLWCVLLISFNVTYYARKRCERDFFNALLMDFHKQFMFVREIFRFFCLFFCFNWMSTSAKTFGGVHEGCKCPCCRAERSRELS